MMCFPSIKTKWNTTPNQNTASNDVYKYPGTAILREYRLLINRSNTRNLDPTDPQYEQPKTAVLAGAQIVKNISTGKAIERYINT